MQMTQKIKQNSLILFILVVGAFLRFYHLEYQSAWADEVIVLKETEPQLKFKEAYKIILLRDSTSFMHVFSVYYLAKLFGHTIIIARLISVIAGILSIFYIYKLGNLMRNKRVGYFAAILLALNLFHIEYSQEARSYAMLVLFAIIAFYRFYVYINKTTFPNALYLGIAMGLVINAHPFGLLNVASIFILLFLTFILNKDKVARMNIFKGSIISGITALALFAFIFPIILAATKIKSFWISDPSYEIIVQLFKDLAGKSMVLLWVNIIAFLYLSIMLILHLKKDRNFTIDNKLFFSYAVLFVWIFFEVGVVLIKSYIGISVFLSRYLIAILPAMVLMVAISIELIRNKFLKHSILTLLLSYSVYNTFYVTDYYNTITKAQYDNLADFLTRKNINNDKVVSRYGGILSYYINKGNSNTVVIENTLDNFVAAMKTGAIQTESFWYFDGNSAPYVVSPENQKFLEEIFDLKENKSRFDCWTKHYVLKNQPQIEEIKFDKEMKLSFKDFTPLNINDDGNMFIYQNSVIKSIPIKLPKGDYILVLKGNSFPSPPIQGKNAHLKIKINNNKTAEFYLSDKSNNMAHEIKFKNVLDEITVLIEYDNDIAEDGLDRNVVIFSLNIKSN